MFDPLFGIALIGAPIALVFLIIEARQNPSSVPSLATCLVALFAIYGVLEWIRGIGLTLFGVAFSDAQVRSLDLIAIAIAVLAVGIPFGLSARNRRRRASSPQNEN